MTCKARGRVRHPDFTASPSYPKQYEVQGRSGLPSILTLCRGPRRGAGPRSLPSWGTAEIQPPHPLPQTTCHHPKSASRSSCLPPLCPSLLLCCRATESVGSCANFLSLQQLTCDYQLIKRKKLFGPHGFRVSEHCSDHHESSAWQNKTVHLMPRKQKRAQDRD